MTIHVPVGPWTDDCQMVGHDPSSCPFWQTAGYLGRPPERLVVDGLRLWAAGHASGRCEPWAVAARLYASALGERGDLALVCLAHWVNAIDRWRPEGLRTQAAGCPSIASDECLGAAMIAACQHGDADCLALTAARLSGPAGQTDVIEAACGLAHALAGLGHVLMPVPADVLRSLVDPPPTRSRH
ncbi:MAG: hypothetical protein AAF321_03810 [Pseudomonadota bacterium]